MHEVGVENSCSSKANQHGEASLRKAGQGPDETSHPARQSLGVSIAISQHSWLLYTSSILKPIFEGLGVQKNYKILKLYEIEFLSKKINLA